MEWNEKLQELRKQKGLTQEQLASQLFISRAAVSKWESGRGYPNIDSLKALSAFFGITIDELLSGEELLTIAEEDTRQTRVHYRDLICGVLDCSSAMVLFLPFFGQHAAGQIQAVSLLSLTEVSAYLRTAYFLVVLAMSALGVVRFVLQRSCQPGPVKYVRTLSFACHAAGVLLFTVSQQPYASVFFLLLLAGKAAFPAKKP